MLLTINQLEKILSSGGALRLAASSYSFIQLIALAGAAASGRARLELIDLSTLTAVQLTQLAQTAPGLIAFDLVKVVPDVVTSNDL